MEDVVKNPKMYLGVLLAITLVIAAIIALIPSNATAQGLIEYQLYCMGDFGAPPEGIEIEPLELEFDVDPWPENWGFLIYCTPKFDKQTGEFIKLKMCGIAYEDVNTNYLLDYGDIKQGEYCTNYKP
jgi:hypothetical protein